MNSINNIEDLRNELIKTFDMVKGDPRRVPQAKEMVNAAGKIISTCAMQMAYAAMRKESVEIPFLIPTAKALPNSEEAKK